MTRSFAGISFFRQMSVLITLVLLVLFGLGIVFIYSSCYLGEEQPVRPLYMKQLMWGIAGIICYWFCAVFDYRKLGKLSPWIYAFTTMLLVLVLIFGLRIYGSKRWLPLVPGADLGIQPSEFAKLATVFFLARVLSVPNSEISSFKTFISAFLIAVIPFGLILIEPDLGTAMVLIPITFIMMFVGGISPRVLMTFVLIGALLVGLVLSALFLPAKLGASEETQQKFVKLTGLGDYQIDRIEVFLNLNEDPLGAGWNKMQSEIAVGSGGLWGKGFFKGDQNILGFLPRSVAPTDFIFSVVAEEKGFMGSSVIIGLFTLLCWLGVRTAMICRDKMGRMFCVGITTMIFCHAFINIAMTVGLMPITGLPLPLLSYGGSFMVVTMSAIGILQSVYIRSRAAVSEFRDDY